MNKRVVDIYLYIRYYTKRVVIQFKQRRKLSTKIVRYILMLGDGTYACKERVEDYFFNPIWMFTPFHKEKPSDDFLNQPGCISIGMVQSKYQGIHFCYLGLNAAKPTISNFHALAVFDDEKWFVCNKDGETECVMPNHRMLEESAHEMLS